jgi:hypothetical protein
MGPAVSGSDLDQVKPSFDALDAIVHLVDPHFEAHEILPQPCDLLLDGRDPRNKIGQAGIDAIESLVDPTKVAKNDAFWFVSHYRLSLSVFVGR